MKDPSDEAILAARIQRAYPQLGPYQSASLARDLGKIERAQRRHAERQCNGPPDARRRAERGEVFGYVKLCDLRAGEIANPCAPRGRTWESDPDAEERASKIIEHRLIRWKGKVQGLIVGDDADPVTVRQFCYYASPRTELEGDPRGAVLKIRFPGETEARSA